MALRFNGLSPTGANPFSAIPSSFIGFTSAAVDTTANLTTQWGRGERHAVKTSFGEMASNPPATENPVAWTLADEGGDLAAENTVNQANAIQFNLQRGINMVGEMNADNAVQSALSMITSMSVDMAAANALQGSMQLTMNLAANLAQSGDVVASLGLIAWCQASMVNEANMDATNLRGTLSMAANIVSYTDMTAEGVRDAVWNAILANYITAGSAGVALASASSAGDPWNTLLPGSYAAGTAGDIIGNLLDSIGARLVENGLSQDEVTRIMFSAIKGTTTGVGTTTETFASDDGAKTRITATYYANGNRLTVATDGT